MRAIMLIGIALALAYVAGWGMAGTELSMPAAVAAFASLGMAVASPARVPPAQTTK